MFQVFVYCLLLLSLDHFNHTAVRFKDFKFGFVEILFVGQYVTRALAVFEHLFKQVKAS